MRSIVQQFIDFFNKNNCGYLATTEGSEPRVRPWSFLFEDKGKIWFMTTNKKRVFYQLKANPHIEFCSCSSEMVQGRLRGKIEFCNDTEIKNRILEERPLLKNIYHDPENVLLETFYLEHGHAILYSSRLLIDEFIEF